MMHEEVSGLVCFTQLPLNHSARESSIPVALSAPYDFSHPREGTRRPSGLRPAALGHYGVVSAAHILYHVPMIRLFRHAPSEADPTFFLNTE